MKALIALAQARAWESGRPWAVVRRSHGMSVCSLRLARNVEIVAVAA